jgi:hypothetical protein
MTAEALALPEMHAIASAVFSHIAYDPASQEIHVKLHSGARHAYGNCTKADWHAFWNSTSRGSHYVKQIKGRHPERRVEE